MQIQSSGFAPERSAVERMRVTEHIQRAERIARARDVRGLDARTRLVRSLLLSELAAYRRAGRFPKNRGFVEKTPYFIDAEGTRCAMAHLLEVGGEGELVARIAKERNNAWVRELADEPRLLAWLAAAGLTVAEAATIQPAYCDTASACVCGDGAFSFVPYPVPARGVLEGVVIASTGFGASVEIQSIHGEGGSYQVGDRVFVDLSAVPTPGQIVLAPLGSAASDAGTSLRGVLLEDGTYTCQSQSVAARPVARELFIEAVQSSDCAGTLASADPTWGQNSCEGPNAHGGCSASGDPSALGILLALVSIAVARRTKR